MRMARQAAAAAIAGVLVGLPTLGAAQEIHPGEQSLLGLTGPQVPELLKAVAADPYKAPAAPACETIPAEILALDRILGADLDQPKAQKSYVKDFAVRQAKGAVRGLIPYRGAIRFLTGADHKDHDLMAAAQAGWARRGFLRGLEANLHCAGPATQVAAAPAPAARLDVRRVETAYAAAPAQSDEDNPAAGDTPIDLHTVMLAGPSVSEPRVTTSEQPGR
ncbi:MAG: hypothetical protein ACJ798_10720 [Phenylobacterium sp.]